MNLRSRKKNFVTQKYTKPRGKNFTLAAKKDIINRRAQRQSKKHKEEIIRACGTEAEASQKKMLDDEMDNIIECVQQGFLTRGAWRS